MSNYIDKSGPAFPDGSTNEWGNAENGGITKRDYFAAKAMLGIIGRISPPNKGDTPSVIAGMAYAMADAMLKAREA